MLTARVCYWGWSWEVSLWARHLFGGIGHPRRSPWRRPSSAQVFLRQPSCRLSLRAPPGGQVCAQLLPGPAPVGPLQPLLRKPRPLPRARCRVLLHLLPGNSHTPLKGPVVPSPALKRLGGLGQGSVEVGLP